MKTKLIITLAFIALNINLVSAHMDSKGVDGPAKSESTVQDVSLAPASPSEATFEEANDVTIDFPSLSSLAPYTPKDAPFDDVMTTGTSPVIQNMKSIEKGTPVHHEFPLPCSVKYGCSL